MMEIQHQPKLLSKEELKQLELQAHELYENKNYELAKEKFGSLMSGMGFEDPEILLQRAQCNMNLKQYHHAYSDAKHALKMEPKNLEACIICGQASTELLIFEDALSYFQEGLKVDPKSKTISEQLKSLHQRILSEYSEKGKCEEKTYNAVKFCSQDPYPGDSELLTLEHEILIKKYHIPGEDNVDVDGVNKEEAAKHAALAFRVRRQNLEEAISQCTLALSKDPANALYRQLRADMSLENGDNIKALSDFWAIPKPSRSYDVWKSGGIILREIELPISAEFWFRRATKLSKPDDDTSALLFQQVRVDRLYRPLAANYPVKVEFRQFGRGIYATEDIQEGDIAFVDTPTVRAQIFTSANRIDACSYCARSLMTAVDYFGDSLKAMNASEKALVNHHWPDVIPVYCGECQRVIYCSDDCRLEAWNQYHQVICPKLNPSSTELYDLLENDGWGYRDDGSRGEIWGGHYSLMVLAHIWASIIMEAKRLMKEEGLTTPTVSHWAMAKAPYRRFISFGSIHVCRRMPYMLPVYQRIFKDCGDGVSFEITKEEFNGRYYQAACNLQAYSASINPYHLCLTSLSKGVSGMHLLKYLQTKPKDPLFVGIFPLHACLNHDCDHNVDVRDGNMEASGSGIAAGIMMVANREIKKGMELMTTYINPQMPRKVRRAWLFKSFNFWCGCQKCTFEGDDKSHCTECDKEAPNEKGYPMCGKCNRANYCSVNCQKTAWRKGHKDICKQTALENTSPVFEIDSKLRR